MFKEDGRGFGLLAIARAGVLSAIVLPLALLGQDSPDIVWASAEHSERINSVVFTPDGGTVISGSSDRLIKTWNAADGTPLQTFNAEAEQVHESSIEAVCISPNGSRFASVSYKVVKLWRYPQGTVQTLTGHSDWVVACAFSPDGSQLATASFDSTVRIWRVSDGSTIKVIHFPAQMRAVAYSPNGNLLACAGDDANVTLVNTSDWTVNKVLSGHTSSIYVIAFAPGGNRLASGGYDRTVKVWNVSEGTFDYSLDENGGTIYGLAFNGDGSLLAYADGEGNTLRVVQAANGSLVNKYTSEVDEVQTMAWSKTGQLAYGRVDKTVVVARVNSSATASITSPHDGDSFNASTPITIQARPSKAASSIISMEFFANDILLGEDRISPFSLRWSNAGPGDYNLTVRETDSDGNQRVSAPVAISVHDPGPNSIVLVAPAEGRTFVAPANISMTANATAESGVSRVEFFEGENKLGEKADPPFTISWPDVPTGSYVLTAVVTGNDGQTAVSDPVHVTVGDKPGEHVKPQVVISSPTNTTRFLTNNIVVRGTASDNAALAQVLVSLNSGEFQVADGTKRWMAPLELAPGKNVIRVKSVDAAGNESAVATRTVTFVVTSPLTLNLEGNGTVTPNRNGRWLEVGKQYTMQAIPASGCLFGGWSGDCSVPTTNLTFTMQENMTIQANFVTNPFVPVKGLYTGLIQSDPVSSAGNGSLRLRLGSMGGFSGRMFLGTRTIPLTGRFNTTGAFSRTIKEQGQQPIDLNMQLDLTEGTDRITGTVVSGDVNSTLLADRAVFENGTEPFAQAGRFTFVLPPNTEQTDAPQAPGFGTAIVDRNGNVTIVGRTGDFVPFTQSTAVSRTGTLPFFTWRNTGRNVASGLVTIQESDTTDMDGTVNWFRLANPQAARFTHGFSTSSSLVASRLATNSETALLNFGDGQDNTAITLGGGNIDPEVALTGTLNGSGQVVVSRPNAQRVVVNLGRLNGGLNGTFLNPATGESSQFYGRVLQRQNYAVGTFPAGNQTGWILLEAAGAAPAEGETPVQPPVVEPPVVEPPVVEPPIVEPPVVEPPVVDPPIVEPPVIEPPMDPSIPEIPPIEEPPIEEPPVEPPVIETPEEPPTVPEDPESKKDHKQKKNSVLPGL